MNPRWPLVSSSPSPPLGPRHGPGRGGGGGCGSGALGTPGREDPGSHHARDTKHHVSGGDQLATARPLARETARHGRGGAARLWSGDRTAAAGSVLRRTAVPARWLTERVPSTQNRDFRSRPSKWAVVRADLWGRDALSVPPAPPAPAAPPGPASPRSPRRFPVGAPALPPSSCPPSGTQEGASCPRSRGGGRGRLQRGPRCGPAVPRPPD